MLIFLLQFNRDTLKDVESIPGRCLVITADGRNGQAQRILGLNDFSEQYIVNTILLNVRI
jgi:hypothetical protein